MASLAYETKHLSQHSPSLQLWAEMTRLYHYCGYCPPCFKFNRTRNPLLPCKNDRQGGQGGRAACMKVPCLTPRSYKPQLLLFLLHNKKEMCSVLQFGRFITSPPHQWGLKSHFEINDSWAKNHIESWVWQVLFVENGIVELVEEDEEGWGKWKWHAWMDGLSAQ